MQAAVPRPGWLGAFLNRLELSRKGGLLLVLLLTVLSHVPTNFNNLSTDDYLIRANIMGDPELYEMGFSKANPDKSFVQRLTDAFHFYTPSAGTLQEYQDYGNLPWWAGKEATMNPLRPLSAITHWVDFQIAPDSFAWQAGHSLLYLLLYAWCSYRLFWRFSQRPSIAVLASLLLVLDHSHYLNFNWVAARNVFIAGALGCAMLEQFILWRQQRRWVNLAAALGLQLAGLLSAESSIALCGYLFAYVLLVERARPLALVQALVPFAVLVLAWRAAYSLAGYGAFGISLYVDPGHSPLAFLNVVLTTLPLLLASLMTTLDGVVSAFAPDLRIYGTLVSLLLSLLGLWLIRPLLRDNSRVRAMVLGSVLAAVPACVLISAGPRAGVISAIGFFWVVSVWLHWVEDNVVNRWARRAATAFLALHLWLPALLGFALTTNLLNVTYVSDQQFESVEQRLREANGKTGLVVINSRAPNREFYLPFIWHYRYGVMPDAVNSLTPGLTSVTLRRVTDKRFEMIGPGGLPLTTETDITNDDKPLPPMSPVYFVQTLQGLFTAPDVQYSEGETFQAADMTVTIEETIAGRPSRMSVEFDRDPDTLLWQWFDWSEHAYRLMEPLAIGESRHFPGPLEADAGSGLIGL